jgi:hypothetical protein
LKSGENKERIITQGREDHSAKLLRRRMLFRDLLIILSLCGLIPGGDFTVHLFGFVENLPRFFQCGRAQNIGNREQHKSKPARGASGNGTLSICQDGFQPSPAMLLPSFLHLTFAISN